ncbi:hydroxysteroid 11-beta-dehydrogenase 1-like protein A [Elgaria multicarinata webbii]|uniref:hydroxysteroid 11-beta-dehydrogenase 1-like protein A n=1 Tax=Elgaria multicarinata webbii TaxID=159646 RepID=UPI002FCD37FA
MALLRVLGALLAVLGAYYFYTKETFSEEMVRGKRVLVTGSSTGIGEQMAYEFARMGAHVIVTARREEQLRKVVQKCLDLGASSASYVVSDMKNLTSAQKVIEETKAALGGLDHLVLNHVGGGATFQHFKGEMESLISCLTVNFFSYVQLTVSALDMLKESRGSITVVSSMSGRIPSPFSIQYSAAKFALEGFYSSLRTELHLRKVDLPITVAVLGYIDTDTALKAVGGKINMQASPKGECAREIVKGTALRQREVFYPYWTTKPVLLLRDWMPELLELFISQAYLVENIP